MQRLAAQMVPKRLKMFGTKDAQALPFPLLYAPEGPIPESKSRFPTLSRRSATPIDDPLELPPPVPPPGFHGVLIARCKQSARTHTLRRYIGCDSRAGGSLKFSSILVVVENGPYTLRTRKPRSLSAARSRSTPRAERSESDLGPLLLRRGWGCDFGGMGPGRRGLSEGFG